MLSDGTWTYTWEHGRQLASASNGTTSVSYEYNADGMRLSKTVGSTTTKYYYIGSELTYMTVGADTLHFFYDIAGPATVCYNNSYYYYVRNAQGDITQILDTDGNVVVSYLYDAWGNVLSVTGSMASTLGALNPLRYRGYVYDSETALYYLQSRYYDPSLGRFICADSYTSTRQGTLSANIYTYCLNNPTTMYDPTGMCSRFLFFKRDCKQPTCPTSKYYISPKFIDPIGTYDSGRGYVYIVTVDQLDKIMEGKEENVVVIVDKRSSSDDPNMQIQDSYLVKNMNHQEEIAQIMLDYNDSNPTDTAWSRTLYSIVDEWGYHNLAYFFHVKRQRTEDCDFNNADEGMLLWDFLGR